MTASYDMNLDAFTITFRREVIFYLRQLINDREPITVMFDEGREVLLTMLLDLDEEKNILIFDWGGSEHANQALLKSARASFVANPVGVRNQFLTEHVWQITYEKRPAFATDIPEKFVRLQRREFFRLNLPMTRRIPSRLALPDANPPIAMEVSLVDIGLGGVGFETRAETIPLSSGQIIPKVAIDLGKFGLLIVDLEVRYTEILARGNKQAGHIGCRFVRLDRKQENDLQRFITQVQCEDRARTG